MKGYIFLDYESGNEKKRINKKDIFELEQKEYLGYKCGEERGGLKFLWLGV